MREMRCGEAACIISQLANDESKFPKVFVVEEQQQQHSLLTAANRRPPPTDLKQQRRRALTRRVRYRKVVCIICQLANDPKANS